MNVIERWLTSRYLAHLERRLERVQMVQRSQALRMKRMEIEMAKDRDALAELDSELDALEAYVKNDEENDAAEIDARVNRVRAILASAQGQGQADENKAAEVEDKLNELTEEALPEHQSNSGDSAE